MRTIPWIYGRQDSVVHSTRAAVWLLLSYRLKLTLKLTVATDASSASPVIMGIANIIVKNYSTMAKVALPVGFCYGLYYSLAHGTSPLADARRAVSAFLHQTGFNP